MPNGTDAGVGQLLTKTGPGGVPVWAYVAGAALVGGGILYYVNKREGATKSAETQPGSSAASSMFPVPPVTYVTGIPDSMTGLDSKNPTGAASAAGGLIVTPGPYAPSGGTYLRTGPNYPFTGSIFIPSGTKLAQAGTPVNSKDPVLGDVPMVPVSYLGATYWISSYDVSPVGGMGGVSSGVSPWESFSQRWHAPQYVFGGMGAGANGHVGRVAARARVPTSRLQAANPHLRAAGYQLDPSQMVRIA